MAGATLVDTSGEGNMTIPEGTDAPDPVLGATAGSVKGLQCINNPLYGIVIGSVVDGLTGKASASVITGSITRMIAQESGQYSMTGQSQFVYSDTMNQGTLGVSGSYGIDGASKLSGALSAYVGNSVARSDESVSVSYNATVWGGIEYIDFNNLSVDDFINSLSGNTKRSALSALDAYNAVQDELTRCGADLLTALQSDDNKFTALKGLVNAWISASNSYIAKSGDGVIVGVLWGGWGAVHMQLSSGDSQNKWKYGGAGDFSYGEVGASAAVKATYDGSRSSSTANVSVSCSADWNGACVKDIIDQWYIVVSGKSFSAIADISMMDKAPALDGAVKPPDIPAFVEPKKDDDVSAKVDHIQNLDGLKDYSIAAAYDKAKKANPGLTLKDFQEAAAKDADTGKLDQLVEESEDNFVDVLEAPAPPKQSRPVTLVESLTVTDTPTDTSAYIPLGVWIANWADLFPWLVTGFENSVGDVGNSLILLRCRTMVQDLTTLSRLYYGIGQAGCHLSSRGDAVQIAQSFANARAALTLNLSAGNADKIQSAILSACRGLSGPAEQIYRKWNDIKFLRDCELGLGILDSGGDSPVGYDVKGATSHWDRCPFDRHRGNYSAFASFVKGYPVITPEGQVLLWVRFADKVSGFWYDGRQMANIGPDGVKFTVDAASKVLVGPKGGKGAGSSLTLFPIPFGAANGIEWKGGSMSTGLKSMTGLRDQLMSVKQQLAGQKAWGLSSDNWSSIDWSRGSCYSVKTLKTSYLGLVDEPPNVFGDR
jgi:hypothetical protein